MTFFKVAVDLDGGQAEELAGEADLTGQSGPIWNMSRTDVTGAGRAPPDLPAGPYRVGAG